MSHFSVLIQIPKEVLAQHTLDNVAAREYINKVLAPFSENLEVAPYIKQNAEDALKEFKECQEKYPEDYANATLAEWADDWHCEEVDEDGNLLSTYNPNSKWDWFTIGGRWDKMLKLKDGTNVDIARVKDIDFIGILEDARATRERSWEQAKDEPDGVRSIIYGIAPDDTKESYIAKAGTLGTFAAVTKEGKWLEKGKMGWWGMSSETPEDDRKWDDEYHEHIISPLDLEDGVAIVDCHI